MTTYKRVKVSTLRKRHLTYCLDCQNFKEVKTISPTRPDGYQPNSYTLSRECLLNPNGELDEHWYHNGAGCPHFKGQG